jgi:hypothetical protein
MNTTNASKFSMIGLALIVCIATATSQLLSHDAEADQLEWTASLGCCEDVEDPTTCYPAGPEILTTCNMDDATALCTWDPMPHATAAKPVTLQCCDDSYGLVWLGQCVPHGPGDVCTSTVVATR